MENVKDLWKKVLADLETEVSKANYLTLLKQTLLLSLVNDTATVAVKSAIHINMIETRFLPLIQQALTKHAKRAVRVVFVPKAVDQAERRPDEAPGPLFEEHEKKADRPLSLARVRPDYTFETFAVSPSNELAFVSTQAVAKNLGRSYNPLFIYGPVGVGKTHLMQAVANSVHQKAPDKKIIYITSEEFTNEVVEAIRSNDTGRMKKRFRSANLLIIDDVQFIAGKDRVQEELFHTFNILIDSAAQIVLSSDRPPSEIKKLEKRLSSRFAGGLTVDVEAPDFELRTAIVLKKAERLGISLSVDVARTIAQKEQDIRSLEGALLRVITKAKGEPLTATLAESSLGENDAPSVRAHPDEIIKKICALYGVKPTQLRGPKRDAFLVRPRQIAMYLLKSKLGISLVEVGNLLGGRDHTTVMYGVEKIAALVEEDPKAREDILGIINTNRG